MDEGKTVGLFEVFQASDSSDVVIPVDHITINYDDKILTLTTRPYGTEIIIPDMMELKNASISLSMDIEDSKDMVVRFKGEWTILETPTTVEAMYTRYYKQFDIDIRPSGVSLNFTSLAKELAGIEAPNPFGAGALVFDSFEAEGLIDMEKKISLKFKAASSIAKAYLIYSKPKQELTKKAIAVDFTDFHFSTLILEAFGNDLSRVPYFGTLTAPAVGLTISSADINDDDDRTHGLFSKSDLLTLLTSKGDRVASGTSAIMKFAFVETLFKLTATDNLLRLVPLDGTADVGSLLSVLPDVDFKSIPFDINLIKDVNIDSFSLSSNDANKAVCIKVHHQGGLGAFHDKIKINNANVNLYLSKLPTKIQAEVTGEINVENSSFTVRLLLGDDDKYTIHASSISSATSPPELDKLLPDIPIIIT